MFDVVHPKIQKWRSTAGVIVEVMSPPGNGLLLLAFCLLLRLRSLELRCFSCSCVAFKRCVAVGHHGKDVNSLSWSFSWSSTDIFRPSGGPIGSTDLDTGHGSVSTLLCHGYAICHWPWQRSCGDRWLPHILGRDKSHPSALHKVFACCFTGPSATFVAGGFLGPRAQGQLMESPNVTLIKQQIHEASSIINHKLS